MSATLLLIEVSSIFGAVYMVLAGWMHLLFRDWSLVHVASEQAFGFSICCSFAFYYNGLYNLRSVRNLGEMSPRLVRSIPLALLLLALLYTFFPASKIAPGLLILSVLAVVGVLLGLRAAFYKILRDRPFSHRVLILGTGPLAQKLIRQIELQPACRYHVVGIVDDSSNSALFEDESIRRVLERIGYPYMGPQRHLRKIIDMSRPDRIIVAQPEGLERCPVRHILLEYRPRGIVIEDGVELYERMTGKIAIEWLKPETLLFSKDFRRSRFDEGLARVASFIVAVLGLIFLAPFFFLVALLIKLDSRGPVLFIQERIGRNGKPFNLLKFRTMRPSAEETISEWARDNADRITRAGKWLRRFRLDELPQFWNVFKGDMNLVGPRPHPASNFAMFVLVSRNAPECGQPIPYYALRSMVRPGITGWAQIRYRYANGLDEEIEKMRYDLFYIKHMSFYFDVRILCQTIKVVFFGQESRDEAGAAVAAEPTEQFGSAA